MIDSTTHDAWNLGASYDAYMGRWSHEIASRFLDWLNPGEGMTWLDVGCGTGALSAKILDRHAPERVIGIEPSEGFVDHARQTITDSRADFRLGDATALPLNDAECDLAVSGLVLNFVPDTVKALREMKRVTRPNGSVAFYVWDYPGGGVEFIDAFWKAAVEFDPEASQLDEANRFTTCTLDGVQKWARAAGLRGVETVSIETPTRFATMDDLWHPFTLGAGPAPGYCMSLDAGHREQLRAALDRQLPRAADGSITLTARAWALKAGV